MRVRRFGSTGRQVAIIGQGTWQLRDPEAAGRALQRGLDLGLTHIDTAELYRGSEDAIRRSVGARRDDFFLVSKVLPQNASYQGTLEACRKSLGRLGTDRLDVYLLHWWSGAHPIEETMRAMGELADQGKIDQVGVSNLSVEQLELAQEALGRRHRIVCDQVRYHLRARQIEADLIPYCQQKDIAVVGYSPFGAGTFPVQRNEPGYRVLEDVAASHGASVFQVTLQFLVRLEGTFAIPKAEAIAHVEDNAAALDFELSEDELRRIDEAFPVPEAGLPVV